ncbi:MAG TPA: prolyl oligopeptidase family serine peptidase [Taishania sp.]|nr:prolyl oligopeptidase family serine peptidase [Taishania sp.]
MKQSICAIIFATTSIAINAQMNYPETKKVNHQDKYFGATISDPYRWLEDDKADDTKDWVKRQVAFSSDYLSKIPYRETIRKQLTEMWNYEKIGAPFKEGESQYFYKNDGLQAQSILYKDLGNGKSEVFLDPNKFSEKGTTSLSTLSFSKSGNLVAYAISEGGSDWNKIIILDTKTKSQIDDTIKDVKFSGIAWKGEEGFFYSSYDKPTGSELSAKTDVHKIYFHKLGTKQKDDQLIIGGEDFKRRYIFASIDEHAKYLIISASNTTYGNELYVKDLSKNSAFIPIQTGFGVSTGIVKIVGDMAYAITDDNAPNKKLIAIDLRDPSKRKTIIEETEHALNVTSGAGYLFANYMINANSAIKQYDFEGKLIREVKLPGLGTISGFGGKTKDKELYYSFTNYITPGSIFKFNPESGESTIYFQPKINFNPADYVTEQVFYKSKDGTKIPMTISYKKGLKLDGKNPTILYSYGGFNISLTPSFSVVNAIWMENGGIYAVPNIRGGGEYGKRWHDAGTKLKKKNVFEDFIAAGEFLKEKGYTSTEYLAISGRSNGGLLVGATMTMKPDFCRVAFPGVGVLDMLRYHTFTAGAGWAYDYGTSEQSKEMFDYLRSYSPVHNVKQGTAYPSTMIITSDHDDRVVPAHSFKFGAELQEKQSGTNPILIRIEMNAGHGAGRSTEQIIGENADLISFALYEMGIKQLK